MAKVKSKTPKHIVITGASSGIGQALAEHYAAPGITLSLTGRNEERLKQVGALCENQGAQTHMAIIDVTNKKSMHEWLHERDKQAPVDLVIANAGISAGTGSQSGEDDTQVNQIFDVNVNGVFNTIHPLLPVMRERGRGQIAIMSSLAGYRGWPGAPAYCASKSAVKTYGEALRGAVSQDGVKVSTICPGFVKSRMTDANDFSMPFMIEQHKAARIITEGLARNKARIVFPWQASFCVKFLNFIPHALSERMLTLMPVKSG